MINQGKITAPVNADEPYKVLGVSPTKGYDIGTICHNGHNKVNKWSPRKPIHYPRMLRTLTDAEFKGRDCGLIVAQYGNVTEAFNAVLNGCDWGYTPPTGGMESPYRLTDFNGYDHNTERWSQLEIKSDEKKLVRFDGMESGLEMVRQWIGSLAELFGGSGGYACLMVFRQSGGSQLLYVMGELNGFDWEKNLHMSYERLVEVIGSGDVYVIPAIASSLTPSPGEYPALYQGDGWNGNLIPLPSEKVQVYVKTEEEQKVYPHEVGVTATYVSGSVLWTEQGAEWVGTGSLTVRVSNNGTVKRSVSLRCFYDQSHTEELSCTTQGGSLKRELAAGGSVLLAFTFSHATPLQPKEVDQAPVNYRLEVASCDGYDDGTFRIGEN